MKSETYNGYTNYETWLVSLWIDNDQGLQELWALRAAELLKQHDNDQDAATADLADEIKADYEGGIPEELDGFWVDLVNAALSEVDWRDVAEGRVSEAAEEAKEDSR